MTSYAEICLTRANSANIYCNKYAIEGAFILCQQFFKGKKSSTVSPLKNSSASFSVKLVMILILMAFISVQDMIHITLSSLLSVLFY